MRAKMEYGGTRRGIQHITERGAEICVSPVFSSLAKGNIVDIIKHKLRLRQESNYGACRGLHISLSEPLAQRYVYPISIF